MASRLVAAATAAAAAASPSRLPPSTLARLVGRRGLADKPWTPHPDNWKVKMWEDPWSPMRWKFPHFVVGTLTVWAAFVSGLIMFLEGQEENKKMVSQAKTK